MVAHDPVTGRVVEYHSRDEDGNLVTQDTRYSIARDKDLFIGFARGGGSIGSGQEEPTYYDAEGNEIPESEYRERVEKTHTEFIEVSGRELKALRLQNQKEAGTLGEDNDPDRFGEVTENARKLNEPNDADSGAPARTAHQHDAARPKATASDGNGDTKPRRPRGGGDK